MRDLAQKVFEALQLKEIPPEPPAAARGEEIPEKAEVIGLVPDHLRGLHMLCRQIEADLSAEEHRRCVAIFGEEEYDNERIEYAVYNEVRADPNFCGGGAVRALLDLSIRSHIPALAQVDLHGRPRFFIGPGWQLYAVKGEGPKARPLTLPTDIIIG